MKTYYAAISTSTGSQVLVPSRKHVFHHTRDAAFRAVERQAKRMNTNVNQRGFVWPTSFPAAMQDHDWNHIETIAL